MPSIYEEQLMAHAQGAREALKQVEAWLTDSSVSREEILERVRDLAKRQRR